MSDHSNDRATEPTQNPEGEPRQRGENGAPSFARPVSGDDAEAAGSRATADEAVSRDDVLEQSAYRDASADPGQQAADAERTDEE
jgi:hypothetical protein